MVGTPTDNSDEPERPNTLAETLFYFPDPKLRQELEDYRIGFERIHGETDLTKRYTSLWPKAQRDWLRENEPKRYFDGLPLFVKAFIKGKLQLAAKNGNLDDEPAFLQRLYISRQMKLTKEGFGR